TCVQSEADTPLVRRQAELGVTHRWLGFDTLRDIHTQFTDTAGALSHLREARPDLVLFSKGVPPALLAAQRAASQRGLPFVVVEGFVAPYWARQFAAWLGEIALHYARARAVVAVSQENLTLLRQYFGLHPGHGEVIHYGRPAPFFDPPDPVTRRRLRQEQSIPEDAVLCFTAARVDHNKGYGFPLEAVRRLLAGPAGRRRAFSRAGGGGGGPVLGGGGGAGGRLPAPDGVRVVGQRWAVADWLAAADVFVLPWECEGMPLAIMEAMARGLPVAATAVSGIPEELGPTGR